MTGRITAVLALALMTAAVTLPGLSGTGDKGGLIKWKPDPQKAMKEARARGAGMMLYFTSEG